MTKSEKDYKDALKNYASLQGAFHTAYKDLIRKRELFEREFRIDEENLFVTKWSPLSERGKLDLRVAKSYAKGAIKSAERGYAEDAAKQLAVAESLLLKLKNAESIPNDEPGRFLNKILKKINESLEVFQWDHC